MRFCPSSKEGEQPHPGLLAINTEKQRGQRNSRAGEARLYTLDFRCSLCYGVLGAPAPNKRNLCYKFHAGACIDDIICVVMAENVY